MSTFKFREFNVYYEVHGDGFPFVVLNGIMMSTQSWQQLIDPITQYRQLILVDMIDQGQTDANPTTYTHDIQVAVIKALFDHLNIKSADLFGISYGGEIALQFVVKYPQLINKLLLFNTASWTSPWLEEVGHAWNFASDHWESYYATTIPVIYSPNFYVKNIEWMNQRKRDLETVFSNRDFMDRMVRLTNSSIGYDIRDRLQEIGHRTLVVASEYDFITPKNEQIFIHENLKNSNFVLIPNVGHASMYEVPDIFMSLILGFILQ